MEEEKTVDAVATAAPPSEGNRTPADVGVDQTPVETSDKTDNLEESLVDAGKSEEVELGDLTEKSAKDSNDPPTDVGSTAATVQNQRDTTVNPKYSAVGVESESHTKTVKDEFLSRSLQKYHQPTFPTELEKQNSALLQQLNVRTAILEEVRTAYLRDIVVLKEQLFRIKRDGAAKCKPWPIVEALPSLDLRRLSIPLYGPTNCSLVVRPCDACAGVLEMVYLQNDVHENFGKMNAMAAALREADAALLASEEKRAALQEKQQELKGMYHDMMEQAQGQGGAIFLLHKLRALEAEHRTASAIHTRTEGLLQGRIRDTTHLEAKLHKAEHLMASMGIEEINAAEKLKDLLVLQKQQEQEWEERERLHKAAEEELARLREEREGRERELGGALGRVRELEEERGRLMERTLMAGEDESSRRVEMEDMVVVSKSVARETRPSSLLLQQQQQEAKEKEREQASLRLLEEQGRESERCSLWWTKGFIQKQKEAEEQLSRAQRERDLTLTALLKEKETAKTLLEQAEGQVATAQLDNYKRDQSEKLAHRLRQTAEERGETYRSEARKADDEAKRARTTMRNTQKSLTEALERERGVTAQLRQAEACTAMTHNQLAALQTQSDTKLQERDSQISSLRESVARLELELEQGGEREAEANAQLAHMQEEHDRLLHTLTVERVDEANARGRMGQEEAELRIHTLQTGLDAVQARNEALEAEFVREVARRVEDRVRAEQKRSIAVMARKSEQTVRLALLVKTLSHQNATSLASVLDKDAYAVLNTPSSEEKEKEGTTTAAAAAVAAGEEAAAAAADAHDTESTSSLYHEEQQHTRGGGRRAGGKRGSVSSSSSSSSSRTGRRRWSALHKVTSVAGRGGGGGVALRDTEGGGGSSGQ